MIIRVDVDNVGATVELEAELWTPELVETLLRMCGQEVVRTAIAIGMAIDAEDAEDTADDDTPSE